jgi:hypothetical protein
MSRPANNPAGEVLAPDRPGLGGDRERRASLLPPSCRPRGLRRPQAAEYVGVSPTKFDEMVRDGRMPPPKKVDGRRIFDIVALDQAFDQLPDDGAPLDQTWEDIDAS